MQVCMLQVGAGFACVIEMCLGNVCGVCAFCLMSNCFCLILENTILLLTVICNAAPTSSSSACFQDCVNSSISYN